LYVIVSDVSPVTSEATNTNRYWLSVTGVQGNESRLMVTGEDSISDLSIASAVSSIHCTEPIPP